MYEPPVFAFTEAALFWATLIWSFLPEIRHSGIVPRAPSSTQDAGTLRLINIGSDVALVLAFTLSFLPWPIIPYPRIALYTGTVLLVLGSLLRRYCFRTLGKYFTAAVTVSADQPVIDNGPYRWIRHPGYTAGFIMFVGIGLALGNCLGLAILVLMACYVYSRRVHAEEIALLDTIGKPYCAYMARTKRFIPFIF
jgi:protein-S-isoprenylcysteine O-methyltransferase Ste14